MAKENKTKYALLGILSLKPASGYDIKKFCDDTILHFWNESYGHIYPVLKKLEEDGLIEKETEINDGKMRNIYRITEIGKQEFIAWLNLPPEIPQARYEFLLKMFFSKDISAQVVIDRLRESKEYCESVLIQYESIDKKLKEDLLDKSKRETGTMFWYATVRYGIQDMKAKILWCEESIELMKRYSTDSSEGRIDENDSI